MARGKTFRMKKKPRKNILKEKQKGGQQIPIKSPDYKQIQDNYENNLQAKKDLYNTIQKEGVSVYDYETSNANTNALTEVNTLVAFIQNFHSGLQSQNLNIQNDIQLNLSKYSLYYTSYFIIPNANIEIVLAESQENLLFAQNIQKQFSDKLIHLHLISQRISLLTDAQNKTNTINKKFVDILNTINAIFEIMKDEIDTKTLEKEILSKEVEQQKTSLANAIALVNRIPPTGFVANSVTPFIQGCPLGTIYDISNNQCVYKSQDTIVETVPFQTTLTNSDTSDYLIWFNSINQQSVGNPTIFKRKPLQYIAKLTPEDSLLFSTNYVVCEQSGALYKDSNGFNIFIDSILANTDASLPGFTNYYIDYDSIPQAVQLINNPAPILREVETITNYIYLLKDIDQVLSGIQYIQTDVSGNYTSIIPFFPEYYDFDALEDTNQFTKRTYNGVDTITYKLIGNLDTFLNNSDLAKAQVDTLNLDPKNYNVIQNIFLNKYTEISIDTLYNPFVLPTFFVDNGSFFMFHNTGNYPIIFDISATSDEKRVLLYPKQIICFVSSSNSPMLKYGLLYFDRIITTNTKSSYITQIGETNSYVFLDNRQISPLVDSEGNLLTVPNIDVANSLYYDYDDIFETNPHTITINKTVNISTTSFSQEFLQYSSSYITFVKDANIYVFSDISGTPNLDILGYFVPIPSPLHYTNNTYIWYCIDKQKQVTVVNDYSGIISIDDSFDYNSQYNTLYSTMVKDILVYVNSSGVPIVGTKNAFIQTTIPTTNINSQLFMPQDFTISNLNISVSEYNIRSSKLLGLIALYNQNISNLQNYYKDISGNMNNLGDLHMQMDDLANTINTNRDIVQLDTYENTLKTIYNNILQTQKNLDEYYDRMVQQQVNSVELEKIKALRKNELSMIQTKINSIQGNLDSAHKALSPLNDAKLENDYESLNKTFTNAQQTFDTVNTNINSLQDIQAVQQQENSTKILLNSFLVLEKNVGAFQQSIIDTQNTIQDSSMNDKQSQLLTLTTQIQATDINTLQNQYNSLEDSTIKQQYSTSLQNIQNILTNVNNDKQTIVTYTNDSIEKQITNYQNYLNTIGLEKQNIQNYLDEISSVSNNELVTNKTTLSQTISQFEDLHENVNTLLNSLVLTDEQKQKYETELLDNYNEVESIKLGLSTQINNTSVLSDIQRVNELITLNQNIQKDLQTIELDSQQTVASPPKPILSIGGAIKKRRQSKRNISVVRK